MKNKELVLIISMVLLINLSGCNAVNSIQPTKASTAVNSDVIFSKLIPVENLNKSFVVGLNPFIKNDLKYTSTIYLLIENKSDQEIWFPVNEGIKIY
ncbi:MAG: hypothetical protein P4L50_12165 [Anaerolineaceae bacterium]|nr:hypothetical protein [Anaerolineaceae bacterium]